MPSARGWRTCCHASDRGGARAVHHKVQCHCLASWGIASQLAENQITTCLGNGEPFYFPPSYSASPAFFLPWFLLLLPECWAGRLSDVARRAALLIPKGGRTVLALSLLLTTHTEIPVILTLLLLCGITCMLWAQE